MAFTIRLQDGLKAEAQAYADALGLSLNGLCAVALRDYLDARRPGARAGVPAPPVPAETPTSATRPAAQAAAVSAHRPVQATSPAGALARPLVAPVPKVPQGHPCPCGSGKKYKRCHGGSA